MRRRPDRQDDEGSDVLGDRSNARLRQVTSYDYSYKCQSCMTLNRDVGACQEGTATGAR